MQINYNWGKPNLPLNALCTKILRTIMMMTKVSYREAVSPEEGK